MTGYTCLLPGGFLDETGQRLREVELRALSGREEELLVGQSKQMSPAALITELLTRCVVRLGNRMGISATEARQLLVADRQYLLLVLRRLTFGPTVQATIPCPLRDCDQRIDIDFSLDDIPIVAVPNRSASHDAEVVLDPETDVRAVVSFRLPNGEDQEAVAPLAMVNPAQALTALLARCIVSWPGIEAMTTSHAAALPARVRAQLELEMEAHAPSVELTMEGDCPQCKRSFTLPLSVQDLFFGEFRASTDMLYRDVHHLAFHYHWSESEIMTMPRERRQHYLSILAGEIERRHEMQR